jgi:hypothetical protein
MVETLYWKVRGALWLTCSVASITLLSMGQSSFSLQSYNILTRVLGMFGRQPLESVPRLRTALPYLVLLSLFWTAWDPTYLTIQRARVQGRDVRLHGKRNYIVSITLPIEDSSLTLFFRFAKWLRGFHDFL